MPYGCSGTVDGKVVDARMAKAMSFSARWGSACGKPFKAQQYLSDHPQFDWMAGILKDRGVTASKIGVEERVRFFIAEALHRAIPSAHEKAGFSLPERIDRERRQYLHS